jgi:SAM-dependent methyltransferase
LATGGGQQAPLLAAAGARVTTIDNSPKQLAQDQLVAEREGLQIETVEGDMADLSMFDDSQFGLIFHACSNCFSQTVLPVWKEAFRVLRKGGVLLAGFSNPVRYAIKDADHDRGYLLLSRKLPWSDIDHLSTSDLKNNRYDAGEPLEFGHTLEDQIGGQLSAGFVLTAMFEDRWTDEDDPISKLMDTFISTRAMKPFE